MKIVVTGAKGFIGSTVCDAVCAEHHQLATPDLRHGEITRALAGAEVVIHLAAIAHRRRVAPGELKRVNMALAERVGRAAAAIGSRLIFISSVKVHGEESVRPFDEASPLAPADPYAESKAMAEEALRAVPNLHLTVLRPPLVYGPGVKANFLALMAAVAHGVPLPLASVANLRSMIYVGNLASAILCCATRPGGPSRSYLISDGAGVSTPALCQAIGSALGRPARLFRFPVALLELLPSARRLTRNLQVDDRAIRTELGWRPACSFEEGLRRTAQWYRRR